MVDATARAQRLIEVLDELERRHQRDAATIREWVLRVLTGHEGPISPEALSPAHDQRHATLLLDLDGVCEELAVSVSTVKRLISSGALPAVKVARSTRVRRSDLEAYVRNLGTNEGKAS